MFEEVSSYGKDASKGRWQDIIHIKSQKVHKKIMDYKRDITLLDYTSWKKILQKQKKWHSKMSLVEQRSKN